MKKHLIIALGALILLGYLLTPLYQFYAHKGVVPMPWWGYETIPAEAPHQQKLYNNIYKNAANKALQQMQLHIKTINSPGISAAIAINGEVVWTGSVGWANIAAKIPVTEQTQFRIGSTSKALTGTLLARMVQNETVSLESSLSDLHVPLGNSQDKALWQQITLRQLASHTSGMPHYKDNTEAYGLYKSIALDTSYADVMDAFKLIDDTDLLFKPGEDFSYSSLGTVTLSAALQTAGNKPYQQLLDEQVLEPLGMSQTSPSFQLDNYEAYAENLATFYWRADESLPIVRPWRKVDLSHRLAGGGLISTPKDLVKLGIGVLDNQFLSSTIRQQFWTPQQLNDGTVNEQSYAIGWRVHRRDFGEGIGELSYANHGGVSRGSQSYLMVIPEQQMAIAVNINAKTEAFWDFAGVAMTIAETFIRQRHEQANQSDSLM